MAPARTEREGGGPSPFGMDSGGLRQCAELLPATHLRLRGLHAHLASGFGVQAALDTAGRLLRFARDWCRDAGVREPSDHPGRRDGRRLPPPRDHLRLAGLRARAGPAAPGRARSCASSPAGP